MVWEGVRAAVVALIVVVSVVPGGAVGGGTATTTDTASTITGEVTYADGSAASGWKVLAGTEDDLATTRTNDTGAFALDTTTNATYNVWYQQYNASKSTAENFPRDGRPDLFALGTANTSAGEDVGAVQLPNASLLHVRVVNESGTPVPNAHVRLYHLRGDARAPIEMATDAEGYAVIEANDVRGIEVTGEIRVEVRGPDGYGDNFSTITVSADRNYTVKLEETSNVTGRIVDDEGDALANDSVVLNSETDFDRNLTDSTGEFQLDVPDGGTYEWVYFQGENPNSAPLDGIPDFYPIGSVSVSGDTALGTEQLPPGYNLTVKAVRPDGTPVENATVEVDQERNGADFGTERVTNGSGEAIVELNGEIHVAVEPPAGSDLTRGETQVTVTADETVEVVLEPAVTVNGTVTDSTGGAAENVRVFYDTEGSHNTALTDSAGGYATAVAANETYRVDLTQEDLPDRADFPDDGVPGVYAYGTRTVGDTNVTHDYQLPYGHDLNVTVVGPDGEPVSDAEVHVAHVSNDFGAGVGGETDAAGVFVPDGADDAGIEVNGTVHIHVERPDGTQLSGAFRELEVSSARNVTVQLNRTVGVYGFVETADGAAAAGWTVEAQPREDGLTGFDTRIENDGLFTGFASQNGSYDLAFRQRNDDDGTVQYPKDGVPDVHPLTAFETGTENVSLGTFTLPRGHLVNVTVVNESGAAVEGVDVYVEKIGPDAEAYAHGVTTANGSLLLDGAAATGVEVNGTVRIDVEPAGGAYAEREVSLNVESNRSVTITLDRAVDLSGRVLGPNGTAVAAERVFAYRTDGSSGGDNTWTDTDGNFTLSVAEDGTYEVGFQQVAGVDSYDATFERDGIPDLYALGVVNGTDGDLGTVQLPDPQNLTVVVENESGHRLANVRVVLGHVRGDASVYEPIRTDENGTVTAELTGEVDIHVPGTDRYLENGTRIELTGDRTVRIVLTEGVPVSGRIEYADGTNASHVTVDAFGDGGGNAETAADGSYSFLVEPNGTYDLAYKQTDFDDATPAFPKDGRADLYAFRQIEVGENGLDTGTQTVPPGHLLNVTIVNESGEPVTGIEVDVLPVNGDVTGHHPGYTNADGEVVLNGAATPGIEANGTIAIYVPATGPYAETSFEFDVGSRRNVTVTLTEPATVTGRVVYPDNTTKADDAVVTFGSETGDSVLRIVPTEADGSFTLETPRASDVDLQFYQGEFWVNLNRSKPIAPRDGVVDLYALTQVNTTTGDVDVGNLTLPEGHVVNVTVVDESGAPVPNATVGVSHYQGAITPAPDEGGADAGIGFIYTNADGMLQLGGQNYDGPSPPPGIELSGNVSLEVSPPENATRFVDRTYTRNLTVTGERNLTVVLNETEPEPTPTLSVGSAVVPPNGTTTVNLTLSSAPDGLAGYNLTITVANASVATLRNASAVAGFDLENVSVGPNGTTVSIKAADTDSVVEPGAENVTVATVELHGEARGVTNVSVTVNQMDGDNGSVIAPATAAGTVTVGAPPAVVGDDRPTDPDGDGDFEDLNGNGRVDFNDVVVFFQRFDDPAVTEYPAAFDLNDNGHVDFDDVVTLFEQL